MVFSRGCVITLVTFVWLFFTIGVFSCVSSNGLPDKMHNRIGCICLFFHTVRYQMSPQCTCIIGRKPTLSLVALVWLFSILWFQMDPQITFLKGCIITLVAFVRFSSAMCFYINPQSKVTLVFSSLCVF